MKKILVLLGLSIAIIPLPLKPMRYSRERSVIDQLEIQLNSLKQMDDQEVVSNFLKAYDSIDGVVKKLQKFTRDIPSIDERGIALFYRRYSEDFSLIAKAFKMWHEYRCEYNNRHPEDQLLRNRVTVIMPVLIRFKLESLKRPFDSYLNQFSCEARFSQCKL